jgi:hypothetical protein
VHQFFFAMGRALGRLEGKKREKRHVTSLQPRLDVVYEILVGAIEAARSQRCLNMSPSAIRCPTQTILSREKQSSPRTRGYWVRGASSTA